MPDGGNDDFGSFQVAITAHATPQKVVPPGTVLDQVASVSIKAMKANTGTLYLGGNNAVSATTGFELAAGESISVDALSINSLWFVGTVDADRFSVMWVGP
jgi:hypothetical protein